MAADMSVSDFPKVTVLMPVYNAAPFLAEAMRSILDQTFQDFEFLIIDDGSTDDSAAIIGACTDSRIRLAGNGRNLGLVASLNRGLELARGEYVARMDADDISLPERLERQVRFMDAHPQVGVCGSWVRLFPEKHAGIWKLPETFEDIRCWQFHTVGVAHPSVMLRRKFFREHALWYDPQYRHIEDYELWGRAMQHMQFANIPQILLEYRMSSGQICATHAEEQKAAVAPLRLRRVRELGIEPTAEEQVLHELIMNVELPPAGESLDRAEAWLLRLERANRNSSVYAPACFSRRLQQIWFSICERFAGASSCSLGRCLGSPLWSTVPFPAWHRLRALGAWMSRRSGKTP